MAIITPRAYGITWGTELGGPGEYIYVEIALWPVNFVLIAYEYI